MSTPSPNASAPTGAPGYMVASAHGLGPLLRNHAAQGERDRRLAPEAVAALREHDLFRLCVPAAYGGLEAPVRVLVEVVEALALADASPAWCVAIGATSGLLGAYLEPEAAREIYGHRGRAVGGVFAPKGQARVTGDGLAVTGRWPFASGIDHCDWLMGGCRVIADGEVVTRPGGAPDVRLVLWPRDRCERIDTWSVAGLRATGSHDMAVTGLNVPAGRSASVFSEPARVEGALYAFPLFGVLALAIAGVALGIGRAALDDLVALAGSKTPEASRRSLGERSSTQVAVADSEARLRAARALLFEEIDAAWAVAGTGGEVPIERRAGLRLAATHATRTARDVVDVAWDLGGGSSIYEGNPLERRFRDVHVATQHMLVAPASLELAGRLLLGLPTDTSQV